MSVVEKIRIITRNRRGRQESRGKGEGSNKVITLLTPGIEQRVVAPPMTRDYAESRFFSDDAIEALCKKFSSLSKAEIANVVLAKRPLLDSAKVYDHLGALIEKDLLAINRIRKSK